jgi:beta-lactam-binding protein with PASTA domain
LIYATSGYEISIAQNQGMVLRQSPEYNTIVDENTTVTCVLARVLVLALAAPALVSPLNGTVFDIFPRITNLDWGSVRLAATYSVEIEFQSGSQWNKLKLVENLTTTNYQFNFVGAQPGRWRVWAVDRSGQAGAKSEWCTFKYTR